MESAKGCQTAPTKEGGKKMSRSKKAMQLLAALLLLAAMFVIRLLLTVALETFSVIQKTVKKATVKSVENKKEEK